MLTYGTYTPLAVAFADTAKAAGIKATVRQGNPDTFFDVVYLHDRFYTTDWQQFFPPTCSGTPTGRTRPTTRAS